MFNFARNQLFAASIIVVIAVICVISLVARSDRGTAHRSGDIKFTEPGTSSSDSPVVDIQERRSDTSQPSGICIHVAGKVNSPGVYFLKLGSRVQDALHAAGGPLANADLDSINLAEKLNDGQQVYVAEKGTVPPPTHSLLVGNSDSLSPHKSTVPKPEHNRERSGPQKLKSPTDGKVNINTASLEELERLPGVGPSTAQSILDYRAQSGRFKAVEELEEIKGIGPKKLEKLRPFASI